MTHDEHPFRDEEQDKGRQFRGRLVVGVTIVTAGHRTGFTASSVLGVEGDPWSVIVVAAETADAWDSIMETSRFVVHILGRGDRELADVFAGLAPAPGGRFSGRSVEDSEWGPVLQSIPNRAFCSLRRTVEVGYHRTIIGSVDLFEVDELDPLIHFRGSYRFLESRP